MPLAAKREPFTYRDLENLLDDSKLREVVGGELFVTAAPNTIGRLSLARCGAF